MSDYSELKMLAEAAEADESGAYDTVDQYSNAATPAVVLALISENERLSGECEGCPMAIAEELRKERDQIKAENEALRNACREPNPSADRYQWLRRQKWFQWAVDEQFGCTETICEQDEQIDAAMGRGEQPGG